MPIVPPVALVAAFLLVPPSVAAQVECAPRATALAALAEGYGEQVIGGGIDSRGPLLEVFVNPETGTWTLLVTSPDGRSCIAAEGDGWRSYEPQPKGEGA